MAVSLWFQNLIPVVVAAALVAAVVRAGKEPL